MDFKEIIDFLKKEMGGRESWRESGGHLVSECVNQYHRHNSEGL